MISKVSFEGLQESLSPRSKHTHNGPSSLSLPLLFIRMPLLYQFLPPSLPSTRFSSAHFLSLSFPPPSDSDGKLPDMELKGRASSSGRRSSLLISPFSSSQARRTQVDSNRLTNKAASPPTSPLTLGFSVKERGEGEEGEDGGVGLLAAMSPRGRSSLRVSPKRKKDSKREKLVKKRHSNEEKRERERKDHCVCVREINEQ